MIKYRLNKYPLSHALCEMHLLLNSPSVKHINKWIQNYEEKSSRFFSMVLFPSYSFFWDSLKQIYENLKTIYGFSCLFYLFMFCKMSHFKYF